jgi:hypothetical protein
MPDRPVGEDDQDGSCRGQLPVAEGVECPSGAGSL